MNLLFSFFLGILQGLTEFLPISSDGHLFILEKLGGLPTADNVLFDVVLHAGTLAALLLYFFKDWISVFSNAWKARTGWGTFMKSDFGLIIVALIPLGIFGYLMKEINPYFRTLGWVALFFIFTGLMLFLAGIRKEGSKRISIWRALLIGAAQVAAIMPGISRSGTTIATGILTGVSKVDAARFSFLIALPAILAATIISLPDITREYVLQIGVNNLLVGFITSFLSSILFVSFFMGFIKKYSLNIFSYYLLFIGANIFIMFVH